MIPTIICADWSKHPTRRRAWELRRGTQTIQPVALPDPLTLSAIIQYIRTIDGSVLLALDAAIGVPQHTVERFRTSSGQRDAGFLDWINWLFEHGEPDYPCRTPFEWHPGRPFIAVPKGKGAKRAFPENGIELGRSVDHGLSANSPLIVSGIPGTVGSGSRELWREISAMIRMDPGFSRSIWPFGGPLNDLLRTRQFALCEIYPKACYGIALSLLLPAVLRPIAKTKAPARILAMEALQEVLPDSISICDGGRCVESEDDFDAMISVVAVYRIMRAGLMDKEGPGHNAIEGDILGRLAVDTTSRQRLPEETDPTVRKQLFRQDFPKFFGDA